MAQLQLKRLPSLIALFTSAILLATSSVADAKEVSPSNTWDVPLDKGALLSLINPELKTTKVAQENWRMFAKNALPLAGKAGYQFHGTLELVDTIIGNHNPGDFLVSTWPNTQADLAFDASKAFNEYKVLRPIIWEKINYYKAPAAQKTQLSFDENKTYTLMLAWTNSACGTAQSTQCMSKMLPTLNQFGGKHIHSMATPRFVSLTTEQGPTAILLTQWDSEADLARYVQSDEVKRMAAFNQKAVSRLEWYRVNPRKAL